MARSDLILSLVQAGAERDDLLFRRTVTALIAEERGKRHHAFAEKLAAKSEIKARSTELRSLGPRTDELAFQTIPRRTLSSLYLEEAVREAVSEVIEEQLRVDLLRSHGLEPRNRILLTGSPGNGKTSLAEAIAEALSIPLYIVRYEGIIANLLGDTARRINVLIERLASEQCVLFFDEFDAIAKFRGDENESGEIKRLVTAILGHLDRLAPHVIVIAATNYPELLDRAIWRRFDVHARLEPPNTMRLAQWIADFSESFCEPVHIDNNLLLDALQGRSYSELEGFRSSVRRRFVLGLPDAKLRRIIERTLRSLNKRPSEVEKSGGTTPPVIAESATSSPGNGPEN